MEGFHYILSEKSRIKPKNFGFCNRLKKRKHKGDVLMQTTKTITKRIWGVLLALCMLLSLMPMAA
ncbi:hypothetical protein, partial [Pseudoflavonifractor phocaeensis]|uniref:hypothetical protein n=1 Tax=Pseudoflavonifractor phocaeensis TaxID=1870988 RepID=UPI00195A3865